MGSVNWYASWWFLYIVVPIILLTITVITSTLVVRKIRRTRLSNELQNLKYNEDIKKHQIQEYLSNNPRAKEQDSVLRTRLNNIHLEISHTERLSHMEYLNLKDLAHSKMHNTYQHKDVLVNGKMVAQYDIDEQRLMDNIDTVRSSADILNYQHLMLTADLETLYKPAYLDTAV